jgi:4-amino-4-deoxy-L-arabinose transferase-like glycosyltransferase
VVAPETISVAPALAPSGRILSTRTIFAGLTAYFALHVVVRVLASSTVELDEAEQVLLAQDWRWGYGAQPPLYTWLQSSFFALFGQNVLALSLLKHLLLAGTFALTYWTARQITQDAETSLLAIASLLFVPQFAWESHRDLTHSVAATACGAATLFAIVRLLKHKRPADYILCGFIAGLGVLAKYNFAIFLLALLLAMLSLRELRGSLNSWWMLAAAAAFLSVTAPHFVWLMDRGVPVGTHDAARSLSAALGHWFTAVVSFVATLLLLMLWIRWKNPIAQPNKISADWLKLLGRTLAVALGLSLLVVLLWKARFKDRWFQPILFALPLYFALWARPRLSSRFVRGFFGVALVIAVATLVAIPAIPLTAHVTGRPTRLNLPYAVLASALRKAGPEPAVILADSRLTGGNLKLHFPNTTVIVPELPKSVAVASDMLVVWDATRRSEAPNPLIQTLKQHGYVRRHLAQPNFVESSLSHMPSAKARWAYVRLSKQ